MVYTLVFLPASQALPIFHWVETNSDTVAKYRKFEVRADITGNFSNPYDFNQVRVYCYFVSPTGVVHTSDGFFYQDFTMTQPDVLVPNGDPYWCIRFAPDEPGNWTYEILCLDLTSYLAYPVQPFYCEEAQGAGYISIGQNQKLVFDNGDPFFGIGTNLAWKEWGSGFTTYIDWLNEMADNGANFTKLTMAPWWTELEWSETGLGNYDARQNRAWAMDRIIDKMDERDIYVQLNFLIHDELSIPNTPGWAQNPYNSSNGGPCGEPQDFFVHQDARNYFKRKIKYINARWGYSTHVQSWEILSEADRTSAWGSFPTQTIEWCNEMAEYTASVDKQNRPVSSGFAIPQHHPDVWNNSANAFTQLHIYDIIPDLEIKNYNYTRWYLDEFQKPVVIGEFALAHSPEEVIDYDPDGITFHNCIWSSVFSGSHATSLSWWWDNYLIPQDLLPHMQSIANFISQVGPPGGNLEPESLHTTSNINDLITIDPDFSSSLSKAPEHYFTIEPSGYLKPLELDLGEVLYGYFFNSSRNPPTFKVNYTKAGEFTVELGDLATYSRIRISLDGVGVLEQPAFTNTSYTINVPQGEHEIKVANVSNGFMEVREYRLLNYTPRLRAFAMRNEKHAVGWIQNRKYNWEYVYPNGTPPPATGGKMYFEDFNEGLYQLDWYDSDGNFESSVSVLNAGEDMVVDAPAVVWDAAFELNFVTPLVVDFIASVTTGDAPLTVQFTDQSFVGGVTIDSRTWDFGDGNFSNQQNPVHTYQTPGTYDVSLKLVSGNYADSLVKANYITAEQALVADFIASDTSVLVGDLIYFSDLSLGSPTSWFWAFGDNSISTFNNPSHLYTQPGFYTVSLLIQKNGKSDIIIKNNYIEVYAPLIADFETDKTLCIKDEAVLFTDLSQGNPESWFWEFGDGANGSTQNPEHLYEETGIYTVKLTVNANWRTDSIIRENLITVVDPLIANFEANNTFVYTGQEILFSDLSTGNPSNWTWEFGDGNSSQFQHPSHNYLQAGIYSVKLNIANEYLEDSIERINYITVVDPLIVEFEANNTFVYTGQEIQFSDLSTGNPTNWAWEFGDDNFSQFQHPVHHFQHKGIYSVKLKISTQYLEDSLVKTDYITVLDPLIADFIADTTIVLVGQEISFTDLSTGDPSFWVWDFGDTSNGIYPNPNHTYWYPGDYSVSLQVIRGDSSDVTLKENYIHVFDSLIADFYAVPTEIQLGDPIQFFDDSKGDPSHWNWDFGDGQNSDLQHPEHTYNVEGTFSIKFEIFNEFFKDSIERENFVTVYDPLIADFIADTTKVLVGQKVQFTDLSVGSPTFWIWDFGDTTVGIRQNPEHYYLHEGSYSVSLQINKGDSANIAIKEDYIQVRDTLIADFTASITDVRVGDEIQFSDLSRGAPNQWFWDFGNSKIFTTENPLYTYTNPGAYSVQLIVKNEFDTDTLTKENYINVLPALVSQSIELAEGWAGISTFINPLDSDIEILLTPLGEHHIFSMNYSGLYWPDQNINTIDTWNPYDGLIIKMAEADTLEIFGVDSLNQQVDISAGWSIFPVVNACGENTLLMQENLDDTLVLIKEIAGTKVFWPEYGINTLEQLEPGKSYYTLCGFETNYQFHPCDGNLKFEKSVDTQISYNPWNDFSNTPGSHLIAVLPGAIPELELLNKKMVIGVFNEAGFCSGVITVDDLSGDNSFALSVFGQDVQSPGLPGFMEEEEMTFQLYIEDNQEAYTPRFIFDNSFPDGRRFKTNGISGISQIQLTEIKEENLVEEEIFIYPNPGNGIFYVDLSIFNQSVRIDVLNSRGKLIKPAIAVTDRTTAIDLSGMSKGIYLVKINSGRNSVTKKVVLR